MQIVNQSDDTITNVIKAIEVKSSNKNVFIYIKINDIIVYDISTSIVYDAIVMFYHLNPIVQNHFLTVFCYMITD